MNNRKNEYPLKVEITRSVERMTFKKLIKDIISAFNIERGLIYTLKLLFINPGEAVRSYLYEGRFKIFQPVRFLIITSASSFLFLYFIDGSDFMQDVRNGMLEAGGDVPDKAEFEKLQAVFSEFFEKYFNLLLWLQIPLIALFSYWGFRKKNYNYTENLILVTYISSMINVLSIISFILIPIFPFEVSFIFSNVISFGFYLYAFKTFFKEKWWPVIYKTLLVYVIGYLGYILILSFISGIYTAFYLAKLG